MIEGRRRVVNVLAVVEAVREAHPLLRRPLTASSLSAVLKAERIRVMRLPVPEKAYVIGLPPAFTIVVSSERSPRYHTRWTAHELGHIKLHFGAGVEIAKQVTPCGSDDPRELEAELFARCLMLGEGATPDHPKLAPLVAALATGELLRRRPVQLNIEFPVPAPVYQPIVRQRSLVEQRLAAAYEDSLAYGEQKRQRRGLPPVEHRAAPPPSPIEDQRTGYDNTMRAAWFRDADHRRWWVFELARVVGGAEKWERLLDSMSPRVTHRLFLSAAGERRLYRLEPRENRAHKPKHLDRQLHEARRLRPRGPAAAMRPIPDNTRSRSS